jgi:hypothetical protein
MAKDQVGNDRDQKQEQKGRGPAMVVVGSTMLQREKQK